MSLKKSKKNVFSKSQLASQKVSKLNADKAEEIRLEAIKKGKEDKFMELSERVSEMAEKQANLEIDLVEFANELGIEFVEDESDGVDFLDEMKSAIILEVKDAIMIEFQKSLKLEVKESVELAVKDALNLASKKSVDMDKSEEKSVKNEGR